MSLRDIVDQLPEGVAVRALASRGTPGRPPLRLVHYRCSRCEELQQTVLRLLAAYQHLADALALVDEGRVRSLPPKAGPR